MPHPQRHHLLQQEAEAFFAGMRRYLASPVPAAPAHHESARFQGHALVHLGGEGAPLLLVPSLINSGAILDLNAQRSFARYLIGQGYAVYRLDWHMHPDLTVSACVTQGLLPALAHLASQNNQPVILAGYCMGGLLALAAAQAVPQHLSCLLLLATPWEFLEKGGMRIGLDAEALALLNQALTEWKGLPAPLMQLMFYRNDPWLYWRKMISFGRLPAESKEAAIFVAVEHWLNNGAALPLAVAQECLIDWVHKNAPALGAWQIAGQSIRPDLVATPTLVVMPRRDKVVPATSCAPLLQRLPRAHALAPDTGHVGMMAGRRAEAEAWAPIADWLHGVVT